MELGIWLAILGILIGVAALGLPILIEKKRKPKLNIEPKPQNPEDPVPWSFSHIQVSNQPLGPPWSWFMNRQAAEGCIASFTFTRDGSEAHAIADLPGRWSGNPEPYRTELQHVDGEWIQVSTFEHSLVPGSYRMDVPATGVAEDIGFTVSRNGLCHAFNSESYAFENWQNPNWLLSPGRYKVVARASAPGSEVEATLQLEVTETGIAIAASHDNLPVDGR